jgi:putative transcriptional regulator
MALHDRRSLADIIVTDDVYVATELNSMESLAASEEGRVIFYVGHAGWGPGQLESEMAEGSWLLLPASAEHVFGDLDPFALWKVATTTVGRQQITSLVPIKHIPENPRAN